MRQDCNIVRTRAFRPRTFPTQYGHAALRRAIGVTCVYQSDSSSKRPVAFAVFDSTSHSRNEHCSTRSSPHAGGGQLHARPLPAPPRPSCGDRTPRPSLCPSACRELLPTPRDKRTAVSESIGGNTDAHKCPRIDDRSHGQAKGRTPQRPRRSHMSR